jgi:hypothetical protein
MCVTTAATCATYEPFVATKAWPLAANNGPTTLRLFLVDKLGNASTTPAATATTTLDTTAPTGGALVARAGVSQLALTWTAATDAASGIASYRVVFAVGAAPASCTTGTVLTDANVLSFTHAGLVNQTTYGYRVCAVDRVGNVAAGVTAAAQPRAEFAAPPAASSSTTARPSPPRRP